LLAAATDQWMLVADGRVVPFEGDLDDYKEWLKRRSAGGAPREETAGLSRRDERRVEAEARQREARARKPFEKRLAEIESELEALSRESTEAEAWLASEDAYREPNRERLQATLKRRADTAARIATLEDDWLWTQAAMEKEVNRARE
jgi:ATP-binding cassette subfamily F protein 3